MPSAVLLGGAVVGLRQRSSGGVPRTLRIVLFALPALF